MTRLINKPFYLIFALIITGLAVANIATSASLSTSGTHIKTAESEITALSQENNRLEQKILEKSSLTYLEAKADQYGFVKPDHILSVATPAPIALSH